MTISHSTSIRTQPDDDELELPVEAVAERLGLPAAMLIRRIEAGDIPARKVEDADGFHYSVRIADLGPSTGAVLPAGDTDDEDDDDEDGIEEAQEIRGTAEPMLRNGHAAHVEPPVEELADDDSLPPPPARGTIELAPLDSEAEGPRAELAMMALDPRELVAGLLDRWERTLEQRIYAEQRQRFEAELSSRHNKVKQLQLELEAVRAEHAAAMAEKERLLAERYYELTERDRQISELRLQPRRRGWFSRH
jgi:hypothetical protein